MSAPPATERPVWLDLDCLQPRQQLLLSLTRATVEILEAASVPCWITGGTLLGALRHKGFVPHDDDVDLECFEADLDSIVKAFEGRQRLSFRLGGLWKETRVGHVRLDGADVELDIFLREAELLELPDFPSRAEVFPLQRFPFNGLSLEGPGFPEGFLARLYGPRICLYSFRRLPLRSGVARAPLWRS